MFRMVILHDNHSTDYELLRIQRLGEDDVWYIEIGPWWKGKVYPTPLFTTDPILFSADDLKNFAAEVRKMITEKPADYYRFKITARENLPDLIIDVRYLSDPKGSVQEDHRDEFEFAVGVSFHHMQVRFDREEDQYLYEEGKHFMTAGYYNAKELEQFADDLEEEANSVSPPNENASDITSSNKGFKALLKKWFS